MKDLKDMCMIEQSVIADVLHWAKESGCADHGTFMVLRKALSQDLSGTVNVPLEPTNTMRHAAVDQTKYYELHRHAEIKYSSPQALFTDAYKAMLSAAKEKNDK